MAATAAERPLHRRGSPRYVRGFSSALDRQRGPVVTRQWQSKAWTKEAMEEVKWREVETQLKCLKFTWRLRRRLPPLKLEEAFVRRQPKHRRPWLLAVAVRAKPI